MEKHFNANSYSTNWIYKMPNTHKHTKRKIIDYISVYLNKKNMHGGIHYTYIKIWYR